MRNVPITFAPGYIEEYGMVTGRVKMDEYVKEQHEKKWMEGQVDRKLMKGSVDRESEKEKLK